MPVVKIQPGPATSYDTYIDENDPAANFKSEEYLYLKSDSGLRQQALVQFDVSQFFPGAIISKAELKFYVWAIASANPTMLTVSEVYEVWYIDTVCWNNRPIPSLPQHQGLADVGAWVTFDVLDIVRDWAAYPQYNLGFHVFPPPCGSNFINLLSGDYLADPTLRPYLEITYSYAGTPPGDPLLAWPVGAVYTSVDSTSPATLFGGTWVAFGAGRVLVGLDAAQAEFDTVEETGGEKTHQLTEAEMPSHTHPPGYGGAFIENTYPNLDDWQSIPYEEGYTYPNSSATGPTGGDTAHNNLQPYIVVYFWKRTA